MTYWTLLILRIMARAGAASSITLAVVSQVPAGRIDRLDIPLGSMTITTGTSKDEIAAYLHPTSHTIFFSAPERGTDLLPPTHSFPGVRAWIEGYDFIYVSVTHWFLCLLFLVAALLTSGPQKKPTIMAENGVSSDE